MERLTFLEGLILVLVALTVGVVFAEALGLPDYLIDSFA